MEHEQGIDSFIEKRTNPPSPAAEQTDEQAPAAEPQAKTRITGIGMKASDFKMKLKSPGAIVGILGLILLMVFAIAPAYKDAPYSRLGLLMRVILSGGSMKPKGDSAGVQAVGGVVANGQAGGDLYAPINVWGSGSYDSLMGGR